MSFVIYNTNSKILVGRPFAKERSAKVSLTATKKRQAKYAETHSWFKPDSLEITTLENYNANIRTTKVVKNLMSGKDVVIDINTPLCCDPSSETYWSM